MIRKAVSAATFQRGERYATPDRVTYLDRGDMVVAEVWGSAEDPYDLMVTFDDAQRSFMGRCTCPMMFDCKHVVATLLMLIRPGEAPRTRHVADWERHLQPLVSRAVAASSAKEIALMFNLKSTSDTLRLTIRPVVRNAKGKWVKTPVSWQTFAYPRAYSLEVDPLVHQLLHEILILHRMSTSLSYYGSAPTELRIDDISSSRLWPCLADLHERGVPFIDATSEHRPVRLISSPWTATLDVSENGESLVVMPLLVPAPLENETAVVTTTGHPTGPVTAIPTQTTTTSGPSAFIFIGQPAHGVVAWHVSDDVNVRRDLQIGPLDQPLSAEVQHLFEVMSDIVIPPDDRARFIREVYPLLRRLVSVSSLDSTFVAPTTTVTLRLTCSSPTVDAVTLRWSWRYQSGDDVEELALWPVDQRENRDYLEERRLLAGLYGLDGLRVVNLANQSRNFSPTQDLTGMAAVRFIDADLPLLRSLEGLEVHIEEPLCVRRVAPRTARQGRGHHVAGLVRSRHLGRRG